MARRITLLQGIGMGAVAWLSSLAGTARADVSMSTQIYEKDTDVPVTKVMAGKPYDLRVSLDTTGMPATQFRGAGWQLILPEGATVNSAKPEVYNELLPNDYFEGATMYGGLSFRIDTNFSPEQSPPYEHFRSAQSGYPSNRNRPVANYVFTVDASRIGATGEVFEFAIDEDGFNTCRVTDSSGHQYVDGGYGLAVTAATFDVTFQGDINGDGSVDVIDLLWFVDAFGSVPGDPNYSPVADLNADASVDVVDLLTLVENWGLSL
jgi:hypothetical protein